MNKRIKAYRAVGRKILELSQLPLSYLHMYYFYLDEHAMSVKFCGKTWTFLEFMQQEHPDIKINEYGRI